jgi:hypothetical protein
MGQNSDGHHQGLVLRLLAFRGRSSALLASCFCISGSSLDRRLVCAAPAPSPDYVVAIQRSGSGWVGGGDFGVVLEESSIIQSPGPLSEHVGVASSSAGKRHGMAQLSSLSVGSSRSLDNRPGSWNDPLVAHRAKSEERNTDCVTGTKERLIEMVKTFLSISAVLTLCAAVLQTHRTLREKS